MSESDNNASVSLPPTWLMALEAKKFEHDLRAHELRGLGHGLLEKATSEQHPFSKLGHVLLAAAAAIEGLAVENFMLKKAKEEKARG